MADDFVQTLWIGSTLSSMERLCLSSFLHHRHEVHLYTYGNVDGIPSGVIVRDANEILPASSVFTYREHPSYAGFSNFFRYKLLLERGGWWIDTDLVCLRPFHFEQRFVFSSEFVDGQVVPNTGAIRVPPGSDVVAWAWECCAQLNVSNLKWGQSGPALFGESIRLHDLLNHVQPPSVFCPVGFLEWQSLLDPDAVPALPEDTVALHLWNEMWRRSGASKDTAYPALCCYERLKRTYLQ